jgi:diacylglycerol kinase family enzyme
LGVTGPEDGGGAARPQPAILLNPGSGLGKPEETRGRLAEIFAAAGLAPRIEVVTEGAKIEDLARAAIAAGHDPIIAGGGDGTINAVAGVVVGTDRTLGVLPLGTFNHFAKDLKLPLDLEEAAGVCLAGHTARVDVGEVNGRLFLNNSGLGLYPDMVHRREAQQSALGRGKWPAVFWASWEMFRRYPFLDVRLEIDGRKLVRKTPFVFIGNNEYEMESYATVGSRSSLDRGLLSLYVAHRTGRLGLLRLAWSALLGSLRRQHDFDALCTQEIWIETPHRRHLNVSTDGEVDRLETPLHYRVRAGALRVLVGAAPEEGPAPPSP